MSNIIIRPDWYLPEREATSESTYNDRRAFLRNVGLGAIGLGLLGCRSSDGKNGMSSRGDSLVGMKDGGSMPDPTLDLYPADRNNAYTVDRPITREDLATTYNNFYEFSEQKDQVHRLVSKFETQPWEFEITGLVDTPVKMTVEDLVRKLPLEERVYRHRCVEAWAMAVPWTGIPMKKVLELAGPKSSAKYVRFTSFNRPDQAPNQKSADWYTWPYYEALRMDEAMNELTMVVTGLYGKPLPKQNGAPIRMVVPWKYGYKSPKSIVKMELVEEEPHTFWNDLAPKEYSFLSNVNPEVPHPRWSQATERVLGSDERVPTQLYNGYGQYVAGLYA